MYKIFMVFLFIFFCQAYSQDSGKIKPVINDQKKSVQSGEFLLQQNYPNPFNSTTNISYTIPESRHVTLKLYNIIGVEIATLKDQFEEKGSYTVKFDCSSLLSGVYFYTIKAGNFSQMKKFTLLK